MTFVVITTISKALLISLIYAGAASALFECNKDQHAFPPTRGKFVVHYASIRDTDFNGLPWVRICRPNDGTWTDVQPLQVPCNNSPTSLSTGKTGLKHPLSVTNGNGCNAKSSNLDGASIAYNGQVAVLQASGGKCGDRDHGISCEFDLD
ncbi:hypothetical protein K435DRAFT_669576 [Dendrothele bispora CBS 962.96]|uniref:Cyanovirin-N domain-containing protein n=1 Tax=Dendrothele bispora (strain CBS 962.96) TaxID=1314807 RepID=A0A4S8LWN1_DENBC|nr:hypothetical protein K435DRAFT_669576 [Dendrothele bispora CBS 962.96]